MGYFRPVSSFNIGKKGEYAERTFFTEQASGVGGCQEAADGPAAAADEPAAATGRPGAVITPVTA